MLRALTQQVSNNLNSCELTHLDRRPIDVALAIEQHDNYERCLAELGVRVTSLPADPAFPDGVFVEDPAVVLDEVAVITRLGAESRRGESIALAEALWPFRKVFWLREPGTLEGGDVLRVGKTLYVGISQRTNAAGAAQLSELVAPFGYRVIPVDVRDCLHLKTACSAADDGTLLINRHFVDPGAFFGLALLEVPQDEPLAANVLRINDTVIVPQSFPKTREILETKGFHTRALDISELQKAEAGLTCSCLLFESNS